MFGNTAFTAARQGILNQGRIRIGFGRGARRTNFRLGVKIKKLIYSGSKFHRPVSSMRIVEKILRYMGFSDLIKIEGKTSFDDLTPYEIGLLIDSFLEDGNEYFDPLAFNDFLRSKLKNYELKKIQSELSKNTFLDSHDDEYPKINTDFLISLSRKLKAEFPDCSGADHGELDRHAD